MLGVSVSLSEAEVHWRDFLASLSARGLHGVKLVVSDAHGGLKPALDARLTGVPWQRCQFHLMKNALGYVPRAEMQAEVVADLRAVFDAPDRPGGRASVGIWRWTKYRTSGPQASRLAGGELRRGAGGIRRAPVAPAAAEDERTCWSGSTRS